MNVWYYRNRRGQDIAFDHLRWETPLAWMEAMQEDRCCKAELKHKGQQTFHSGASRPESYGDMLALVLQAQTAG
jgi:hypothetical protein